MSRPRVQLVLELELAADPGSDDVVDAWAWALERQVETMDLVTKATVIDFTTMKEEPS